MNDVMEQIKTLSATLDEETTRFHPTGRLLLLGSYESVFQWKEYHNERGNGDIQRNPHSENDETGFECSNATK